MIYILVHTADYLSQYQEKSITKDLVKGSYHVLKFQEKDIPNELNEYIRFTKQEITSLYAVIEAGSAIKNKKQQFYQREPFASKELRDGQKLFRRKHGYLRTIPANSTETLLVSVPYAACKINKLEVIDANARDIINLSVLDTPEGLISGYPNVLLNQFGFDVVVSDLLYSDKSDYDADLVYGMQIKIDYENRTGTAKEVGFNIIFHEVV